MPTPGLVAHLRINPTDAMSVVDVIDKLGISKDNLSFNQAVKIVISSALEAFRQNGTIPRRDGFEFNELLAPFTQPSYSSRGAKLRNAAILSHENAPAAPPVVRESPERRAARVRYEELMFKARNDEMNFSHDEQRELATLIPLFQS